ncbi:contactin-5-like isoform X2 [Sparus aurata]|uniref:contactin-5-like isoform X2 n=1 Tax=Sparus aurata TaxID=8175 RepID=UPI0011C12BA8|nr:contactin-5-like isoform X2 [Sparus aurata]
MLSFMIFCPVWFLLTVLIVCRENSTGTAVILLSVPEDHHVRLPCGGSGSSDVVWTHQDRTVLVTRQGSYETNEDPRRYRLLPDGSLCLLQLDDSDDGEYRCNQQLVAELQVLTGEDFRVPAGRTLLLPCSSSSKARQRWFYRRDGGRRELIFTWFRNSTMKPERSRLSYENEALQIRDLQPEDAGQYQCSGKTSSVSVLTVQPEPTSIHQTSRTTTTPAVRTTEIKHEVVQEKQSVSLPCLHSVEGEVTWSRETNGHRVDILTTDGDRDKKHIPDPGGRYSSLADAFKSLYIHKVNKSDSGTYLCNNEAAVELTVIPSETTRLVAPKSTTVTLNCPLDVGVSHVPTWSKDGREVQQDEYVYVSPADKTLTITFVQPHYSGLYYCDGKPAAYLTVMEAETSDRGKKKTTPPQTTTKPTMTTLTTTTSPSSSTVASPEQQPSLPLVIGIIVPLLLIILLIFYLINRHRFKRRGTEERCHVYDEIQGGAEFQVTNGVERVPVPTDAYCMVECPGGSNPNDPTYYTIPDRQPMEKTTKTSGPDESLYSEICEPFLGGNNNEGSSQPTDNTYCLLQNPKTSGRHPK